ncbi:hypothetical protein LI82_06270 [Methanococcoides methylutens]|uniref:Uncharacterized protein n=1 Tax=Methanococcoides methylutens TaxID=2226 RepID=A0A099T157_METMT|nr:hypothetical protein [Methanococcoides methylutens]KGK98892.1 hypothetical protein LI82_06270 [Methanococcoides methylutens]
MIYEYHFLLALLVTVMIEVTMLFTTARYLFKINRTSIPDSLLLFTGTFCSFSTLPYLWFVLPMFIRTYSYLVAIGEVSVVLVEAVIYFFVLKVRIEKALFMSFICNLASFLIGIYLFSLF